MPNLLGTGRYEGRGTRYNHVSKVCFSLEMTRYYRPLDAISGERKQRAVSPHLISPPFNRLLSIHFEKNVFDSLDRSRVINPALTLWMKAPLSTRAILHYHLSQVRPPLLGDLRPTRSCGNCVEDGRTTLAPSLPGSQYLEPLQSLVARAISRRDCVGG